MTWPAGRYNAFVAYASPLPQTPECREANERRVQQEICLHKAGRPYFRVARDHVRIARKLAQTGQLPGFTALPGLVSMSRQPHAASVWPAAPLHC